MKVKISYVKPCTTKKDRLEAEVLTEKLNLEKTYNNLKEKFWKDINYSKDLGAVNLSYKSATILIFEDGRILIRRVKEERDIIDILKEISNYLIPYAN